VIKHTIPENHQKKTLVYYKIFLFEHSGFIPSISFDTEDKLSSPFLILGINTEQNIEIEN